MNKENKKVKVNLHYVFVRILRRIFSICFYVLFLFLSKNCVGSVVEWLKHRTDDQHGLGSKPTSAILLCPWEKHFTPLSPARFTARQEDKYRGKKRYFYEISFKFFYSSL